ncbi:hypothetical protein H1R20_g660, partial [Candolleomyces eurysporus]
MATNSSSGNLDRFQGSNQPLNWSMLRLLAALMAIIDDRHGMLNDLQSDGLGKFVL